MGFLGRLRAQRSPSRACPCPTLRLGGEELIYAVGESHYQPALLGACDARPGEPVTHDCTAVLVPEPTNPHDPNAVMVWVDGNRVAYLSRSDALAYGPTVRAASRSGHLIACAARISGRGESARTANLGIFLLLALPPEALSEVERLQ